MVFLPQRLFSMARLILSINAGSSSVKVSVYKGTSKDVEPEGLAVVEVSGLTAPPATLKYDRGDVHIRGKKLEGISTQTDAFQHILDHLINDEGISELKHKDDVEFACHRIVHGGDYDKPVRLDRDTYHHIEALSDLAPLLVAHPPKPSSHPDNPSRTGTMPAPSQSFTQCTKSYQK